MKTNDLKHLVQLPEQPSEELQELMTSMKETGLLHPITVRAVNGSELQLLAGEKRLQAAILLGWEEIPVTVKEVSDVEAKIIRVHENLHRHNLPWYEQAQLVQQLHELRQEEHGKKSDGRPSKDAKGGWSMRDTAKELGIALGRVSEDVNLAQAVLHNPALRNVADRRTAVRLVRIEARRAELEAEQLDPDKAVQSDEIFLGDSASVLSAFPDGTFDACVTDPPWIKFYDESLRMDERTLPVFREIYRVLKANALLYIFAGDDDFDYYKKELPKLGFVLSKTPLIWQKLNSMSRRGVRAWEYDRDYELIIVAAKGNPVLSSVGNKSSILTYPIVPTPKMIHPNEKPVALIERLIDDCSFRGALIVEPFGGSGVTAEACLRKGRKFVICERDKNFYDGIVKRIARAKEGLSSGTVQDENGAEGTGSTDGGETGGQG